MALHNDIGKQGEDLATNLLTQKGYHILERNWRLGHLEVDIIAANKTSIHFVEVKTRSSLFGSKEPEEYVDSAKQRFVCTASNAYIKYHQISLDVRFDIIAILINPDTQEIQDLRHIEDAFYPPQKTVHARTYSSEYRWHSKAEWKRRRG